MNTGFYLFIHQCALGQPVHLFSRQIAESGGKFRSVNAILLHNYTPAQQRKINEELALDVSNSTKTRDVMSQLNIGWYREEVI